MTFWFAGDKLTDESLELARLWFHNNSLACVEEAEERKDFMNDYEGYVRWQLQSAEDALTIGKPGGSRVSLAFLQRAHIIQTGKCVALLP